MDEQEIDLRRYALALARRWRLIALMTLLAGGAALAVSLYLAATAPVYEARALVLITRPRYQLELEPKFKTTEDAIAAVLRNRMETLVTLARSADVEAAVQRHLADKMPVGAALPVLLAVAVKARTNTELLEITVQARDAQGAADLANAWAEAVAARTQEFYGVGKGSDAIAEEMGKAQQAYEAAERDLIRFAAESRIEDLTRRVKDKEDEIKALQEQKTVYLREKAGSLYASLNALDQVIRDAQTLKSQLRQPGRSQAAASGDALAVLLLRAAQGQARPGAGQAISLQLSPERLGALGDRPDEQTRDLEALVRELSSQRAEIQSELDRLSRELQGAAGSSLATGFREGDPLDVALTRTTTELQKLRAALAEQIVRRDELTRSRDILRTSYTTLRNKAEELRVARATTLPEAIVAETATQPLSRSQPKTTLNVLMAGVVGLVLGLVAALVLELWGQAGSLQPIMRPGRDGAREEPVPVAAVTIER